MYLPLGESPAKLEISRAGARSLVGVLCLALAGVFLFAFSVQAACSNPSPLPSGYAAPCPVFSVSPASVPQTGTETLSASPQPGTDYIYTTAYYAKGSTWLPVTLAGNYAAPSYSSGPATGSLPTSILSTLPLGTNYVVLWDWLWDATAQCYKGPGLNQCNTGTWRIQSFTLTSTAYTYPQSAYTSGCTTGCNNYYVSTTGSDSNPGTQASPWRTINHAAMSLVLGAAGTVVHVASGTYSSSRAGSPSFSCVYTPTSGTSASRRIVYQSDIPYSALIICADSSGGGDGWNSTGQWVDIVGFDLTGTLNLCNAINLSGANDRAIGNKVHDIPAPALPPATSACGTNGGGGITMGGGPSNVSYIGNLIDKIGDSSTCNSVHGLYVAGPNAIVENNVVSRSCGWGIHVYHNTTNEVVTNNTIINNLRGGIMMDARPPTVNAKSTISNNILINNGQAIGGFFNQHDGITQTTQSDATNVYRNNLLINNQTLTFNLANLPVTSGNLCERSGTGCQSVISASQVTLSNIFVNYTGNAVTGDYHLKTGSVAIGTGVTGACASGGISPCTPTTDFDGKARPNPPSIGAYEF